MILEQIAADTRLRLIEEKKLVSPEEMKEKISDKKRQSARNTLKQKIYKGIEYEYENE